MGLEALLDRVDPTPPPAKPQSGLPVAALGVEVWFTVERAGVAYAGLVAAQRDAPGCACGWSLGYSTDPAAATESGAIQRLWNMKIRPRKARITM